MNQLKIQCKIGKIAKFQPKNSSFTYMYILNKCILYFIVTRIVLILTDIANRLK